MHIVYGLDGVEGDPVVAVTTPGGNLGQKVLDTVGAGNRYYAFQPIPFDFSNGIVVNWAESVTCSDDVPTNNLAVAVMLETPPLDMISAA